MNPCTAAAADLGYFDGFNDYLHSWSYTACLGQPGLDRNITYEGSAADRTKCTAASVKERHLKSTTDLWLNDHPAHGLNGSGFEEAMFEERVLGLIGGHDPAVPLFLYYPMHLVHSPLCVPEGYLEKFAFIAEADDNAHHDRQYVAAMLSYMDDIVGNVAQALEDSVRYTSADTAECVFGVSEASCRGCGCRGCGTTR